MLASAHDDMTDCYDTQAKAFARSRMMNPFPVLDCRCVLVKDLIRSETVVVCRPLTNTVKAIAGV